MGSRTRHLLEMFRHKGEWKSRSVAEDRDQSSGDGGREKSIADNRNA